MRDARSQRALLNGTLAVTASYIAGETPRISAVLSRQRLTRRRTASPPTFGTVFVLGTGGAAAMSALVILSTLGPRDDRKSS
jgi:hypothetical protein